MTDLQKLIADARRNVAPYRADRDAGKYVPGIGLIFDVERLANALEALNRENETMTARVIEYLDAHEHPDDWGVTCVYTRGLRALLASEVSS